MKSRTNEQGFTLVELSVVMIIIGLLIGGVLKGQEMVKNARIAALISEVESISVAATTFTDKYGEYPGDMRNVQTRIAGIGPGQDGDGNGRITNVVGRNASGIDEVQKFFTHLRSADLIGGRLNGSTMESSFDGAFYAAGFWAGGNQPPSRGLGGNWKSGHYIAVTNAAGGIMQPIVFDGSTAARIDRKMDDGNPSTGSVRGAGGGACLGGRLNIYDEDGRQANCGLYIRLMK